MSEPAVVPYCYRQSTRGSPTDDLDDGKWAAPFASLKTCQVSGSTDHFGIVSCLYSAVTANASTGRPPVRGWTLVRSPCGGLKWVPSTGTAPSTTSSSSSNSTTTTTAGAAATATPGGTANAAIASTKDHAVEAMDTDQEAPTVTTDMGTAGNFPLDPSTASLPLALASTSASVSYYTDEQYERLLVSTEWTREETDYLFSLCDRYYHRLIVVAGHYAFRCRGEDSLQEPQQQQQQQRSLEDIRERYYQVMNQLRLGETTNATSGKMNGSFYYYDKEGDKHRRLVLNGFLSRPTEVQAEEALLAEAMGAMRLALPQVLQERERLLLCCGGLGQHLLAHAPTLPELCGGSGAAATGTGTMGTGLRGSGTERKNKRSSPPSSSSSSLVPPATGGDGDGDVEEGGGGGGRRKRKKQSPNRPSPAARSRKAAPMTMAIDSDTVYGGERSGMAGPGRRPKPVLASTIARSSLLRPLRVGLTRQVDKMLLELGLGTLILRFITLPDILLILPSYFLLLHVAGTHTR